MSVVASVVPGTNGDQLHIIYSKSSAILAEASTSPMTLSVVQASAGIGLAQVEAMVDSFVPATGVYSFKQDMTRTTAPLPDIWWTHEVRVDLDMDSGTPGAWSLIYESIRD